MTDYTYDADERLATEASGSATVTYGYNAAGQLKTSSLPVTNGYTETRTYDRAGRLIDVVNANATSTLSHYAYTLDAVGNPTRVSGTDPLVTYTYDGLDRLTRACWTPANCSGPTNDYITYTYDGVGNRLTEVRPAGTTTYSYNASDQLTSTTGPGGTVTYGYDTNGNETSAGAKTFTYNLAGEMTSATVGGTTTSYSYDGDGIRLQASIGPNASDKTNYLWDPTLPYGQIALERDGSNSLLRRYVYGVDRVSMNAGGTDYYFQYDGLGSVVNVTSALGVPAWQYSYEPFGRARTTTQLDPLAPSNEMRFAGEQFDSTGLHDLRSRQYDSATGRFLGLDTLAADTSSPFIASYAYADDRPTVLVDPSGMGAEDSNCRVGGGWVYNVSDFFAGFGDFVSSIPFTDFSLTHWARSLTGGNDAVNPCSEYYMAGELGGFADLAIIGGSGLKTVGGWIRSGREFEIGENFRIAPFGNRGPGRFHWPHYHRAIYGPDGEVIRGGSFKKHRPWQGGW